MWDLFKDVVGFIGLCVLGFFAFSYWQEKYAPNDCAKLVQGAEQKVAELSSKGDTVSIIYINSYLQASAEMPESMRAQACTNLVSDPEFPENILKIKKK